MNWVLKLPAEKIKQKTLDAMPEYSTSEPSGVTPGKTWKRNVGLTEPPTWVICEYVTSSPNHCRVEYRKPEIIV